MHTDQTQLEFLVGNSADMLFHFILVRSKFPPSYTGRLEGLAHSSNDRVSVKISIATTQPQFHLHQMFIAVLSPLAAAPVFAFAATGQRVVAAGVVLANLTEAG